MVKRTIYMVIEYGLDVENDTYCIVHYSGSSETECRRIFDREKKILDNDIMEWHEGITQEDLDKIGRGDKEQDDRFYYHLSSTFVSYNNEDDCYNHADIAIEIRVSNVELEEENKIWEI